MRIKEFFLGLIALFAFGTAIGQKSQLEVYVTSYFDANGWQRLNNFVVRKNIGPDMELEIPYNLILDEKSSKVRLELNFQIDGVVIFPLRLIVRPYNTSMVGDSRLEQQRINPRYPIYIDYFTHDIRPYNQLWLQVFLPENDQRRLMVNNQIVILPFNWAAIPKGKTGYSSFSNAGEAGGGGGYQEEGERIIPISSDPSFVETRGPGMVGYEQAGTLPLPTPKGAIIPSSNDSGTGETRSFAPPQNLYAIELYAGATSPNVFTIRREAGIEGLPYFEKIGAEYRVRIGFFTSLSRASEALYQVSEAFPQARVIQEAGYFVNAESHRGAFAEPGLVPQGYSMGSPKSDPVYHTVQQGENLFRISQDYDIPLDQIRLLNNFEEHEIIIPGQNIRVK